ncbi:hypothetical protein [Paenibacillus cymbidii]|uniref:hypothetical protein n=1 Tax=Paenibacillus cymbidii TaxID=1639034 RepID=UPI0010811DED|nr:hypothetical protein [Paenibacillus cymbidii]
MAAVEGQVGEWFSREIFSPESNTAKEMETIKPFVDYEQFGAVGDGVTDDIAAICAAHDYANAHRLPVKTKPDATYYIGPKAMTAVIQTDVDWNTSHFTIDDTAAEDNKAFCFHVKSALRPFKLNMTSLGRDQKQVGFTLDSRCYVVVTNTKVKKFIRRGLNQNNGFDQTDCFVVHEDGSIVSPIDWDYDDITDAEARPIDKDELTVRGGIFTTMANRGESKYDYYHRGIRITRSNTTIDGITHYVAGEIGHGSPYGGFIHATHCAYVTVQNCFVSGHKIYTTIGSAGEPVMMGSYDLLADNIVDYKLINCTMNNITDRTRWGVICSNFCKNILVENCTLSRLDAHMGVSGTYTIKDSTMGWQGVNAIGRGQLTFERVVLYGRSLVQFRNDYGSTWEGDVTIRDCTWIPDNGAVYTPELFTMKNDGTHDFGYACFMPQRVKLINLHVDDSHMPEEEDGFYLFSDPSENWWARDAVYTESGTPPYPYVPCQKVVCRNLTTASGKQPRICRNPAPFAQTELVVE